MKPTPIVRSALSRSLLLRMHAHSHSPECVEGASRSGAGYKGWSRDAPLSGRGDAHVNAALTPRGIDFGLKFVKWAFSEVGLPACKKFRK